jgi:hypothetical protein
MNDWSYDATTTLTSHRIYDSDNLKRLFIFFCKSSPHIISILPLPYFSPPQELASAFEIELEKYYSVRPSMTNNQNELPWKFEPLGGCSNTEINSLKKISDMKLPQ